MLRNLLTYRLPKLNDVEKRRLFECTLHMHDNEEMQASRVH